VVTAGQVRVGDPLEAGKAVLTIAQVRGFRVDLAVPSAEISHIHEGMTARIKLDSFDQPRNGTLRGTVYQISPDSQKVEGQHAVIYVVRVALEDGEVGRGENRGQVKFGMTGRAEMIIGRDSLLTLLFSRVRRAISLG
jgi:multidrug efflux pump subunit AcrA (membrane-fusion protein)